jgi:hypothetical protein
VGHDAAAANCIVTGAGVEHVRVGEEAAFTVELRDSHDGAMEGLPAEAATAMVSVTAVARMADAAATSGSGGDGGGGDVSLVAVPVSTACVGGDDGVLVTCKYTVPPPAAEADEKHDVVVDIVVQVLGQPVPQSPFAVVASGARGRATDWRLTSVGAAVALSEDGRRATKTRNGWVGAIADGAGCEPMAAGRHYWEIQRVVHGDSNGVFMFGVCRPGINVAYDISDDPDTWLAYHFDGGGSNLFCSSCKGTGCTDKRDMADDERVGLLLDLDNGGTLTLYRNNIPCGTIAVGLVGPLLPFIASHFTNTSVRIHGNVEPPQ